uniref:Ycf36 n=1 Tax=Chondria sp. (in: red algae) TaxID=1982705 RepID=A0A1Z1ME84_9FLOR|nr:hypothetical protein [Chondria sp. (in: red algae)]
MSIFKNDCPVPFEQQPINEYLSLKKSYLFSWSVATKQTFILGFVLIFMSIFILVSCILFPFYSKIHLIRILVVNFAISNIIFILVLTRLYLGWSYVVKRLLSATIFYEESGWYDGQVWVKTSDYLMQDRLVGLYQVIPFIARIKYTFIFVVFNCILSYLLNGLF